MRFWLVRKYETEEAIIRAIQEGSCTTEAQVEEIARKYGESVEWVNGPHQL